MSDFFIPTGVTKTETCHCGSVITKAQEFGAASRAEFWSTARHDAPCGLPCLAGGVYGQAYRRGRFHRDAACPSCARALQGAR